METRPMRTRKVIALSLIFAGVAILSGCPDQPAGPCLPARAFAGILGNGTGTPYVVQYYLTAGSETGDCTSNAAINAWPHGNFVGQVWAEAYGPVTASKKLTGMVPEEFGWTNQFTGDYVQGSPNSTPPVANNPVIFGNFTTDTEDSAGTCTIQGTDAGVQLVNGVTVSYDFKNVLMLVQAAAGEGTQMQASVTITRTDPASPGTACVRKYTALGLWPSALCNVDNDCNPYPQPGANRPLGSGLLPGIPYTCNSGLVAQDPILVPTSSALCGETVATPFILENSGCGGGSLDNNGTAGTSICFFQNPSPTKFPYLN